MTADQLRELTYAVGSPDEQLRRLEAYACAVQWPEPRPPRVRPERPPIVFEKQEVRPPPPPPARPAAPQLALF